jgi:predicted transcriptional regulator
MAIQLSPELEENLQDLAAEEKTTADDLAQQALSEFVAYRRMLSESAKRGRADVAAGRVVSSEEVLARIQRNLAAH